MAEVTLTDVTKRFGDIIAVKDMNLVIEDGRSTSPPSTSSIRRRRRPSSSR